MAGRQIQGQGGRRHRLLTPHDLAGLIANQASGGGTGTNDYNDLINKPVLGTAASHDVSFFALASDTIQSIVAGSGINIDSSDPLNPIISAVGGSGGSANRVQAVTSAPITVTVIKSATSAAFINTDGMAWPALDTTITTTSLSNFLKINFHIGLLTTNTVLGLRVAIFVNGETNASIVESQTISNSNSMCNVTVSSIVPVPVVGPVTLNVRVAVSSGTCYINSNSGSTVFNGVGASYIEVEEVT